MAKRTVREIMLPLSDYAVVDEGGTILDALNALQEAQRRVPPGKQPHRAILVTNQRGEVTGKLHHFAFLRALVPGRRSLVSNSWMNRAGVEEELRAASLKTLDYLTADLVDVCERARRVTVRDVSTPTTVGIPIDAPLSDAILAFLHHQTLSLLVSHEGRTAGILRLSDLFEELAGQIMQGASQEKKN